MDFNQLAALIKAQFNQMAEHDLFIVDVDKHTLWDAYMDSFPTGTNEIYRERRTYDCNYCRNFIRDVGNVVAIIDGKIVSVWDVETNGYYQTVTDSMSKLVKSKQIKNIFISKEPHAGKESNVELLVDNHTITWNHFNCQIPKHFINRDKATVLSKAESFHGVFKRGLEEISIDSLKAVIDLIESDTIYRGSEHLTKVKGFLTLTIDYAMLDEDLQDIFTWQNYKNPAALIRNSVIGSLLVDINDGKPIEEAVKSFEAKVAPANYKRTKAVVTQGMIDKALKTIDSLGVRDSLPRRHATSHDLSINNVLFADRSTSFADKDPLAEMLHSSTPSKLPNLDNLPEMSIADFMANILPKTTSIEALMENSHAGNLASIVAPVNPDAPNILQWDNNFSWSYNGEVTDSMKEKVVAAGGRIDGAFRFTHSWNEIEPNGSLMDLHVFMPDCKVPTSGGGPTVNGRRVGWNCRSDRSSGGTQDVDYTNVAPTGYIPVENITFPDLNKMPDGIYTCKIHNWSFRSTGGKGKAEIEFNGELHQYEYPATKNHEWITVAEVILKNGQFTIKNHLESSTSSKEIWNIKTQSFVKVSTILLSPNHWDGQEKGNKHYFFTLQDCLNPDQARGLYSEFLRKDLHDSRKVFELLGSKLKCPNATEQLSGLGFSSTMRNSLVVRTTGEINKLIRIKF